jgi:phosphatidylserine/phosphatidylglycerophosphate/cardiolipin synthase-like enzyme
MPTLTDLKAKWFIPMDGSAPDGVPCRRHSADTGIEDMQVSTDNNTVTPLIDGKVYMRKWHEAIDALAHLGGERELYIANYRFENVKPLGELAGTTDARDDLDAAADAGVDVFPVFCFSLLNHWYNAKSVLWLQSRSILTACLDCRFPGAGGNHQKLAIVKHGAGAAAIVGSVDVAKQRWDTVAHLETDPDRDPAFRTATHDTGVFIEGPAVADLATTFRERWNDPSRLFGLVRLPVYLFSLATRTLPPPTPPPPITSANPVFPGSGTHSVQVLRTYGITWKGYSWSDQGEFTVWASHLNAIGKATQYIYIEDQYFMPFDWPPCFSRPGLARTTDLVYQLGKAIKRGVKVVVVTPLTSEDAFGDNQKYQRDVGINYLLQIAATAPGSITVADLQCGGAMVYVHSKLMIVDDEFVSIGSANFAQRSMTHDSEVQVAIVDSAMKFAHDLRVKIWGEHTGLPDIYLDDPVQALGKFQDAIDLHLGHLEPYVPTPTATFPAPSGSGPSDAHKVLIELLLDPYAGPGACRW